MDNKYYDKFRRLVEDKNVMVVPIFSMFDHISGICNMKCDGNVSRYITTFHYATAWKSLTTFSPTKTNAINIEYFRKGLEANKIDDAQSVQVIEDTEFKNHAAYIRGEEFANNFYKHLQSYYKERFDNSDVILFDGQQIGLKLLANRQQGKTYIYWCPVCATDEKTRSFLEANKQLDQRLFNEADYVIVASLDQLKYLEILGYGKKTLLLDKLASRDVPWLNTYKISYNIIAFIKCMVHFNKQIIYLPFRISDEGYQVVKILDTIYQYGNNDFVILCPNLNNDELFYKWALYDNSKQNFIHECIYKIDDDKDTYLTLLSEGYSQVVIPYFEDTDFIMHGTYNELISGKTTAQVFYKPEYFTYYITTRFSQNDI